MNPLLSATADAFRGHGFSVLVATLLRGLQLMLIPQKSPPALQSTSVSYSTTTKEGRRQYKSYPFQCASSPLVNPCTTSKDHLKIIELPIRAHHVEETDHLRHRSDMKQIYACQKETIECVCGDEIEKHGYVGQP